MRPTPESIQQQMVSSYQSGSTMSAIAIEHGKNIGTVWGILKRNGVQSRPSNINLIPEGTKQGIVSAYQTGSSMTEIATEYNKNVSTIWHVLKRHGIQSRPHGTQKHFISETQKEAAISDYVNSDLSLKQVGKKYGASGTTFLSLLVKNGIARRTSADKNKRLRKHKIDLSGFISDNPEKFYWTGFCMADSYVNNKTKTLRFNLQRGDRNRLERLSKFVSYDSPVVDYMAGKSKSSRFHICSEDLLSILAYYGVVQKKSLIATPKNIPPKFLRYFLLGLYDGDGFIYKSSAGVWSAGICGSENCVNLFAEYLRTLSDKPVRVFKQGNIFYAKLHEPEYILMVLKRLYKGAEHFCLPRKYKKFKELEAHALSRRKA